MLALFTLCSLPACDRRAVHGGDAGASTDGSVAPDSAPLTADAALPDAPAPATPCRLLLDGEATTLSDPQASASTPSIAYDGTHLAVLWARSDPVGHPVVRMRLLDRAGAPVKSEVTAGPESHAWAELAASAADGGGFGMCFHTDPQYTSRLAFRHFRADGSLDSWREISRDYGTCYGMVALPGGGFALGARAVVSAGGSKSTYRLDLLRLDATGAMQGKPRELSTRNVSHGASLAVARSGELYAAYTVGDDTSGNSAVRVMVQRFDAAGSPVGSAQPATSGARSAGGPALVFTDGALLLAYGEEQPAAADARADRALFVTRLDARGARASAPVKLTGDGARASYISAAATDSGAALSWTQSSELELGAQGTHLEVKVMLAHLDSSGARLQSDVEVAREIAQSTSIGRPQLAYVSAGAAEPRRLAVVWHQRRGQDVSTLRAVHLRMLRCAATRD